VIKPDAIPVRRALPRAVLSAEATRTLFGSGYALRGSESVRVVRSGRREVRVPAVSGSELSLTLGALERDVLGDGPPLRLVGPAGSLAAPAPSAVARALRLPAALVRAWGLALGQVVTVQAGAVAFGDVVVEEGEGYVALDRADLLAARLGEGDTVRWRPQLALDLPKPTPESTEQNVRATGRLITENDVRQARLRGQRIIAGPGHLITPAARSLGRELGVLDDA
jgi:hypothetical protein